ncbi:MAG: hypothetical protein DBY25_08125 [Clostridiales bacterium]|nr:MAG: hypothetical protein DBY25_08125 [Clostridiales bacterium]
MYRENTVLCLYLAQYRGEIITIRTDGNSRHFWGKTWSPGGYRFCSFLSESPGMILLVFE